MKVYKFIIIFLLFNLIASADKYSDSLKQILKKNLPDSERVVAYVTIANDFSNSNLNDSALRYFELADKLAKKVSAIKFSAMVFYYRGLFYQNAGEYAKSINLLNNALTLYLKINRFTKIGDVFNSLGVTYYYKGNYDSAIINYENAVPYFAKSKNILGTARCYNNIGIMYDVKGDRVKSVQSYLKAIKIYEANNREDLNTGPYQNIALVYLTHKQYNEALKNLDFAKQLAIKYKDEETLCRILNSIGACYDNMNKSEEANKIFNEALLIAEKSKNVSLKATCLTNLGENYLCLKKYEEGEKILTKCVEIKKQLDNPVSLGISQIALAQAYYKNKKFNLAIASYNEGLKKVKEADYKEYQKTALQGLASSYASINNYKEAYGQLDQFVQINDSLLNESNKKIVAELQTKYESDKKETEIKLLSKDKQLQGEEIKREKIAVKFVTGIGVLIFILLVFAFFSWRNKKKANLALAEKNNEIKIQRDEIRLQKEVVEEKQKEIVDSITYAKRLQEAILPPLQFVQKHLPESFILYKPKAIVAGDFYWMELLNNEKDILIAAADCTGHGVPGAMVSVVCSNALNRSVKEFGITEPGKILDKTRELVLETFEKSTADVKDGMDISLASVSFSKNNKAVLKWSGANNPLWYISKGELITIPPNKQPIGKTENIKAFETHVIELDSGDCFYLFSDGFVDQFGGPKGKKFKHKQLQEFLMSNKDVSMKNQREILNDKFEEWKGNLEQVDDVCIIGIRI